MHTFGDLKASLAEFCDGGLCVNDTGGPNGANRVELRINEAVERLMQKTNNPGTVRCLRLCAHNGCITCGRDIQRVMKAKVDGEFAHVFDKWYEYLEDGPGMLEDNGSAYVDLIDRGQVVTQYDIPEPTHLMIHSDTAEDPDAELLIRGYDETGREVRTNDASRGGWYMGEYVRIYRDIGWFTQAKFSVVTSVQKPVTNGYVYLSAVYFDDDYDPTDRSSSPSTFQREHLAGYHPDETLPEYRRYAFQTAAYAAGNTTDYGYRINALCKMKFVKMTRDTDISPIDSLPAIKTMVQALRYQDVGDIEKGEAFEQKAERLLIEALEDFETDNVIPEIQLEGWSAGGVENVQ